MDEISFTFCYVSDYVISCEMIKVKFFGLMDLADMYSSSLFVPC